MVSIQKRVARLTLARSSKSKTKPVPPSLSCIYYVNFPIGDPIQKSYRDKKLKKCQVTPKCRGDLSCRIGSSPRRAYIRDSLSTTPTPGVPSLRHRAQHGIKSFLELDRLSCPVANSFHSSLQVPSLVELSYQIHSLSPYFH